MASPFSIVRFLGNATRAILRGDARQLYFDVRNRLRRVDLEYVSVADLGLPADVAHFHSQSGGDLLRQVFARLPIPKGSVALDFGSGKGGAIISLHQFGFAEIRGVELSEPLVAVARENMRRLGLERARFFVSDAAKFRELDDVTHIYLYNPFPCPVVADVIRNIESSLAAAPRELHVVYRNALCQDLFDRSARFTPVSRFTRDRHEWRIWKSVTPGSR